MPFQGDLESSEVERYAKKYLAGAKGVPVEDYIKILRLIENMSRGTASVGSMHGGGIPPDLKGDARPSGQTLRRKNAGPNALWR